jgi:hypothetical protein
MGVCLYTDQTVAFFYEHKEVFRSDRRIDGLVKNITVGADGFFFKVHPVIQPSQD